MAHSPETPRSWRHLWPLGGRFIRELIRPWTCMELRSQGIRGQFLPGVHINPNQSTPSSGSRVWGRVWHGRSPFLPRSAAYDPPADAVRRLLFARPLLRYIQGRGRARRQAAPQLCRISPRFHGRDVRRVRCPGAPPGLGNPPRDTHRNLPKVFRQEDRRYRASPAEGHPVSLTLRWLFREHRDGETARFRAAGYELYVIDMDGDGSEWSLKRGKAILAQGGTHKCVPLYHFDACLVAAEAALREVTRDRIADLRKRAPQRGGSR
jgi:hypothetical protein